MPSIRR
ncbi:f1122f6f-6d23-43c9-a424-83774699856d [Thermothielavioides terrestris]|nr:f1122f6f-6d23-43c9-a424-83774699856d [Thermothielavioides terrestris]